MNGDFDRATTLLHRSVARRMQRVDDAGQRLNGTVRLLLAARARRLNELEVKLRYFDLRPRLSRDRQRLQQASARAATLMQAALGRRRERFGVLQARLQQLNPRLVLSRGYAIVLNDSGEIVKQAAAAPDGSGLRILFAEDAVKARVTESPAV